MSKLLLASLILPPIFMAGVIFSYHHSKKKTNANYLAEEVKYERPATERAPAKEKEKRRKQTQALFHETFSK